MTRNIILSILGALLSMFIGYAICYYFRPFELPTLTPAPQSVQQKAPAADDEAEAATEAEPADAAKADAPAAGTDNQAAPKAQPAAAKPAAAATAYPQLEGGEYEIVGVQGTEVMKPGKTLLNISLKYFKSTDFVPYICKMNGIDNPDIVPLDKELKIPELKRK